MNDFDAVRAKFFEPTGTQRPLNGLWRPDANTIALTVNGSDVFRGVATGNSNRTSHTGSTPVKASTDGNDTTPAVTEEFVCEVELRAGLVTGFANFNGSAVAGNLNIILYDRTGVIVANSSPAGVAQAGIDSFQRIPFSTPYQAVGGTYYLGVQCNNVAARINTHPIGNFGTVKKTAQVFGTFTALTPPTTFTANVGPMGSFY